MIDLGLFTNNKFGIAILYFLQVEKNSKFRIKIRMSMPIYHHLTIFEEGVEIKNI